MGGEDVVRQRLEAHHKTDELLAKSLVSKKPAKTRRGDGHKNDSRQKKVPPKRRRSASRSRSRSPRRSEKPSGTKDGPYKKDRRGGKSSRNRNRSGKEKDQSSEKKDDKKREYSHFSSPPSFEEAWMGSFFPPSLLLLITSLGFVVSRIPVLHNIPIGGRLNYCSDAWKKITSNSWVYNVVDQGYKIPFKYVPKQRRKPSNPPVTGPAYEVLATEAAALQQKCAVVPVSPVDSQYCSSYFAVPKARSPGKFRPILNLKKFNRSIKKYRFKMEGLRQVRDWIKPNAWMCVVDLKDQFLHVPINKAFHKFLRFTWNGVLLEWRVLPFGLRCSPRVVTKILKPVMAYLRTILSILISIYIDDMLIQATSAEMAFQHTQLTALILMVLGWSLNWEKSCFIPKQEVVHLGFIINTVSMTLKCPPEKVIRLQEKSRQAMVDKHISVHNCEKLLGYMESVRPATPFAAMHYRPIQRQLLHAKRNGRTPHKLIHLSTKSIAALTWWVSPNGFAGNCTAPLREPEPTVDIWTDANLQMGGAHNSHGQFCQRQWSASEVEADLHISLLETRAAREAVGQLARPGDTVRLHIDNTSACAYIRKQGGTRSYSLSEEACLLWRDVMNRKITLLTPQWLGTKENSMADFLSRNQMDHWEIYLDRHVFEYVLETFQLSPTLDAFASRLTTQLPRYMTWFSDSCAVARDAMLATWDPVTYLFPPTPMISKVIQKVEVQGIRAILICPRWPSALWWPLLLEMLVEPPLPLPHYQQALHPVEEDQSLPYMEPLVALHILGSRKV